MRNNTIPLTNQVVPVSGNYVFSPEDNWASLTANWAGGYLVLPPGGINSAPGQIGSPPNFPQNGDQYCVADPVGRIANGHGNLAIYAGGNGYEFMAGGALVTVFSIVSGRILGQTTTVYSTLDFNKQCLCFVFDANQNVWIVC